jgi:hypothetical protein
MKFVLFLKKNFVFFLLVCTVVALAVEIFLRLTGTNAFYIQSPRFFEANFQYDSYFGWVGKPNYVMDMTDHPGLAVLKFDARGFIISPHIQNDPVVNTRKVLFIGACDSFGGPALGPEQGYVDMLAADLNSQFDFDVFGASGYSFYQEYLLQKKYNQGGHDIVFVSFYAPFFFYLDTQYALMEFGNRFCPHPRYSNGILSHNPVPYIKSYWEQALPFQERFNLKEKIFIKSYLLSKIMRNIIINKSFNPGLTRHIAQTFKEDVEQKGGKMVILIFNFPLVSYAETAKTTDAFIEWLQGNHIDYIDFRKYFKDKPLSDYTTLKTIGDPTHFNYSAQITIKNVITEYLHTVGLPGENLEPTTP